MKYLLTGALLLTLAACGGDSTESGVEDVAQNLPPSLTLSGMATEEDTSLSIGMGSLVTDGNSDALTITIDNCPQNISCSLEGDTLVLTPSRNYFGSDNLIGLTVTDAAGASVSGIFNLEVNPVNDAPVWQTLPTLEVEVSKSVSLQLADFASDIDIDELTFSVSDCPSEIQCSIDNHTLVLAGASEVKAGLKVSVVASDAADSVETRVLLNVKHLNVDQLDGMDFYPEFNGLTGNDNVTLSFTSSQAIATLMVNGESESLPTDSLSWQKNYPLVLGDNVFDIQVQTRDKSWQFQRILKYAGPMHHGSSHGKFNGDNSYIVRDYRRGGLLSFDLDTLESRSFDPTKVAGLGSDVQPFVANGDNIIGVAYDYEIKSQILIEINTADNTVSRLHTPERYQYYNALTLSDDGSQVYFFTQRNVYDDVTDTWREAKEFFRFELSTRELTLLADITLVPDGEEITSLRHMAYDAAANRLLIIDHQYRISMHRLLALPLEGNDAGRLQQLSLSTDSNCIPSSSDLTISYTSPIRDGNWLFVRNFERGHILQLDVETLCLTRLHQIPETLQRNRQSLQGIDINTATGELYLGFYSGPIVFDPVTATYKGLEIDGLAGPSWEVGEPAFMAFDSDTQTVYYADEQFLISYNLSTAELAELHQFADYAYGVEYDKSNQLLYIADGTGELGKFDLMTDSYTRLLAPEDGYDPEHLIMGDNGKLYFLQNKAVMAYDIQSGLVSELSADAPAFTLYRENHMVFDRVNQRLIIDTEDKVTDATHFIAIDVQTGARTILNPDNTQDHDISDYLSITNNGNALLFYEGAVDSLIEYDITTGQLTELASQSEEMNKMSDVTDIIKAGEHRYLLGDDDLGGFWWINSITNERILLR